MNLDISQLLAWCLRHIKCDACGAEGARLTRPPGQKEIWLCPSDERLVTWTLSLDQPPLFPSTTTEEEAPENP